MEPNNIEKNIQDKLQSYENFDGDKMAMWAAVEEGLDDKKKKRRFFFWFWFGGLALIIGSFALLFWSNRNSEPNHNNINTTDLISSSDDAILDTSKTLGNMASAKMEVAKNVNSPQLEQPTNVTGTGQKEIRPKTNTVYKSTRSSNDFFILRSSSTITNDSSHIKFANIKSKNGLNDKLSYEKHKTNNNIITSKTTLTITPLYLPSILAEFIIPPLDIQPKGDLLSRSLQAPRPLLITKARPFRRWSVNVTGGISSHNSNYSNSEISDIRSATETNLPGWQIQLELSKQLYNGISLTSGIQFNRAWTKLEFNQERTTKEILENIVTTFHINNYYFASDTILEFGDAAVNTKTKRDVQHHNRYDRIQIPLLIGKHFQKRQLFFGLQAGVGLDIWMHRSGKAISIEEGISEFNQNDSDDYNRIGSSLKLRGILGYTLTNRTNIYLQPAGNWSLSDWTRTGDELTQKPFTYGLNLGFSFRI